MHKTINDNVFGELTYKHSWFKEDEVDFFGKIQKVKIKIQAYGDSGILQSQRDNYKNFKIFIKENLNEIYKRLHDYCKDFYETDENIKEILELTAIYFAIDGSWGMLFESKFDIENGLAIFFKGNDVVVDTQDTLL